MKTATSPARECLIQGVVGETGVGKSYQLHKEIKFYIGSANGRTGRRVLIFDTNGEYEEYREIKNCSSEQAFMKELQAWDRSGKVDCRRINAKNWSLKQKYHGLLWCHSYYKNGLLVVDDIDKIAAHTQSQEIISTLMGNRHDALDVILCHQSLDMPTTNFYRNVTIIRLHHQRSNEATIRNKTRGSFTIIKIASLIIDNQYRNGNIRFFLLINVRKEKIYGCTSEREFELACRKYLALYPTEVKHELAAMHAEGRTGLNRKNDMEIATQRAVKRLHKFIEV